MDRGCGRLERTEINRTERGGGGVERWTDRFLLISSKKKIKRVGLSHVGYVAERIETEAHWPSYLLPG